jgi:hypothetical protein
MILNLMIHSIDEHFSITITNPKLIVMHVFINISKINTNFNHNSAGYDSSLGYDRNMPCVDILPF